MEMHSERTRGRGHQLQQEAFQLDRDGRKGEGRKVFSVRVVTQEHVAQRRCGVSLLGDTQHSPGQGPEQLDLTTKVVLL